MPKKILFKLSGNELLVAAGFALALLLLPLVILLTLREANSIEMKKHSREISSAIADIRNYYSENVIERLQKADGQAVPTTQFREVSGGIPIPATFSIEIGEIFNQAHIDGSLGYGFISDHPFTSRVRAPMDHFQSRALTAFREDPKLKFYEESTASLVGQYTHRYATPVIMQQACVSCHNAHPNSTRRDWKVGDIRGIQEVSLTGSETNLRDYRYIIYYITFITLLAIAAVLVFKRTANQLQTANLKLANAKESEAKISSELRDKVQQLELLAAVAENSTFGITIADTKSSDLPLVYVNPAFTRITGYTKESSVGQNCRFMKGPETSEEALVGIREALKNKRAHTVELVNYRINGQKFWNRLTLFPVGGKAGQPDFIVGYQIDVTAMREAEAERESMMAEIQENQKLESLGIMVAGVAHEINNPLGIALTATTHISQTAAEIKRELRRAGSLTTEVESFLDEEEDAFNLIHENLKRAVSLVASFKDVATDSTQDSVRAVDLQQYLNTTALSVRPILRRVNCNLKIEVKEGISLSLKTGSFGQLITNLIVNATVHAFDGIKAPEILIRGEQVQDEVVLTVSDNGNGIPGNIFPEIFTPFFTSKRATGGTGLGLYIARRIAVDTLHGSLSAENKPEGGAIFTLRFPIRSTQS